MYSIWRRLCQNNNVSEFEAGHKAGCVSLVCNDGRRIILKSRNVECCHCTRIPCSHVTITDYAPNNFFFLQRITEREPTHTSTAKLPITDEILEKLYSQLYQSKHGRDVFRASVVIWRTVWRISLEYHTLGRFSDIVKLKKKDVVHHSDPSPNLRILFKGGKTINTQKGGRELWLLIPMRNAVP